jgi:pimeloyl-ACP methyl ester carboxylesterase
VRATASPSAIPCTASRFAVLVHALAMDRHFWDPVARRLPSDAAVLTYDCRGHGASGAGEKVYSVEPFADAARPDVVSASIATFLRNDPRAYAASCRMLGAADLRPVLAAIRAPTAVVVGEQDYATPVGMAEALHSNIKDSTLLK